MQAQLVVSMFDQQMSYAVLFREALSTGPPTTLLLPLSIFTLLLTTRLSFALQCSEEDTNRQI